MSTTTSGLAQLRLNVSSVSQDRELLGAIQILCTALLVWKRCISPAVVSSPHERIHRGD